MTEPLEIYNKMQPQSGTAATKAEPQSGTAATKAEPQSGTTAVDHTAEVHQIDDASRLTSESDRPEGQKVQVGPIGNVEKLTLVADTSQVDQKITDILNLIIDNGDYLKDKDVQDLVGQIVGRLSSDLVYSNPRSVYLAYLATAVLIQNPPKIALAKSILERIGIAPGLRSPGIRVMFGLGSFAYLVAIVFLANPFDLAQHIPPQIMPGVETKPLVVASVLGALGSTISMLIRINSFEYLRSSDYFIPTLIGFVRPIIGGSFGLFVFLVISSGLISISIPDQSSKVFFYMALAFISGFSERFVPDIISRVEGQYTRTDVSAPKGVAR